LSLLPHLNILSNLIEVTDETSEQLQDKFIRSLQERFPNDHTPADGLIYQRIRYYGQFIENLPSQTSGDHLWAVIASNHWWAILEKAAGSKKGKYLRAFLKHPSLPQAFDELLPIPGIWEGMRIGLLHKLKWMRCDEVSAASSRRTFSKVKQTLQPVLNYLRHIGTTFSYLVGGTDFLPLVDGVTVNLLQSRAPNVSRKDLAFLKKRMEKGEIFKDIEDEAQRHEVWNRLKGIGYPIPTLKTFFKDRLYLEVGRSVMQQLFIPDPQRKITIDESVGEQWGTAVPMPVPYRQQMIRSDLYELWRFSFQYGFEMTNHQRCVNRPRPGDQRPSITSMAPRPVTIDRSVLWQHFFWLARQRNIWPPLADGLQAQEADLPAPLPCDYPENDKETPITRRCGKPFTDSADADRYALTRESLEQVWNKPRVTAGFVTRSIFLAFFGYLIPNGHDVGTDPSEPNNADTDQPSDGNELSPDMSADTSNNPSEENFDGSTPLYSTSEFNPVMTSQQPLWASQQPSFFAMNLFIPGEPIRELKLPNDQHILNRFFAGLERHHFHIYIPGDDQRALHADWCYSAYEHNSKLLLHADFLPEGCFEQLGSTALGHTTNKRRRTDGLVELNAARSWLEEQIAELHVSHIATQVPPQFMLNVDETMEEL
jgi:Protein of unknown function (DUF3723).